MCDNGEISVMPPRLPQWVSPELRTLANRAKWRPDGTIGTLWWVAECQRGQAGH
jgi:hypothetical protein